MITLQTRSDPLVLHVWLSVRRDFAYVSLYQDPVDAIVSVQIRHTPGICKINKVLNMHCGKIHANNVICMHACSTTPTATIAIRSDSM